MLKGQSIELDLDEFLCNRSSYVHQDENSKNTSSEIITQMQTAETPHNFIKIEDSNNESSKRQQETNRPPIYASYSTRLSTKNIQPSTKIKYKPLR